jgi:hypothetical protein
MWWVVPDAPEFAREPRTGSVEEPERVGVIANHDRHGVYGVSAGHTGLGWGRQCSSPAVAFAHHRLQSFRYRVSIVRSGRLRRGRPGANGTTTFTPHSAASSGVDDRRPALCSRGGSRGVTSNSDSDWTRTRTRTGVGLGLGCGVTRVKGCRCSRHRHHAQLSNTVGTYSDGNLFCEWGQRGARVQLVSSESGQEE